jgi:hypothetical protein
MYGRKSSITFKRIIFLKIILKNKNIKVRKTNVGFIVFEIVLLCLYVGLGHCTYRLASRVVN